MKKENFKECFLKEAIRVKCKIKLRKMQKKLSKLDQWYQTESSKAKDINWRIIPRRNSIFIDVR